MADGEWIATKTLLPVDPCPQNSTTVVTLMLDMNYSDLNDYDITIDEKKSMVIIIKKLTNLLNQKKNQQFATIVLSWKSSNQDQRSVFSAIFYPRSCCCCARYRVVNQGQMRREVCFYGFYHFFAIQILNLVTEKVYP